VELRHLRYFVAVADRLHFGRAAAALRIAQPSLSQQIARLEAELQATLFRRSGRRVHLTEPGRLFLAQAREILARADQAAFVARRAALRELGHLQIGYSAWVDPDLVAEGVRRLQAVQPGITVDLRSMSVSDQVTALRDERLDIGFLRPPVDEPSLASEAVSRESFVLALSVSHPLSGGRRRISMAALARERMIFFPRDRLPILHRVALALCRDAGFVPRISHEAESPEIVLALVRSGAGLALVPQWVRTRKHPGVVFRPISPADPILHTVVAWPRKADSPLVPLLVQLLRDAGSSRGARSPGIMTSATRVSRA